MRPAKAAIAEVSMEDLLRSREVGTPVVSHVLEDVSEPKPDFKAMQRTISGAGTPPKDPANDNVEGPLP
jgi:hypothetical protein